MSFRGRLSLFFLLIVVMPMIAVAVLVVQVSNQARTGKADARLAEGLQTALSVYRDDLSAARKVIRNPQLDAALGSALRGPGTADVQAAAATAAREHHLVSILARDANGHPVASVGHVKSVAAGRVDLRGPEGPLGSVSVSVASAKGFVEKVRHLTAEDAIVVGPGGPLAGTVATGGATLPAVGQSADVDLKGQALRGAAADLPGMNGLHLVLLGPRVSGGFFVSSPLVIVALVAFFGAAVLFVAMLLRVLQGQIAAMLGAARRIGGGDFSQEVPVLGNDEMAGLAREFNKMSDRLSAQMDELRRQRDELEKSVRRIGDAFASGLDRPALLEMVLETSLGACNAQYGRISLGGRDGQPVEAGSSPDRTMRAAIRGAEEAATRGAGLAEARSEAAYALSSPLSPMGREKGEIGLMTVVRHGASFSASEHEVFRYLIGQASTSIENVALHELVSAQAVTDELTGLPNNRRFREVVAKEAARAQRFGHALSLLMLDLDDFKHVNDTYGHLQGDLVLKAVGQVLDEESRGVDEPARYGGEEFVVALPETDITGAVELAERIRERIESTDIQRIGDGGEPLRITASVGAASLPASAATVQELIGAADAALYEAKRGGKNRVAEAPPAVGVRGRSRTAITGTPASQGGKPARRT